MWWKRGEGGVGGQGPGKSNVTIVHEDMRGEARQRNVGRHLLAVLVLVLALVSILVLVLVSAFVLAFALVLVLEIVLVLVLVCV